MRRTWQVDITENAMCGHCSRFDPLVIAAGSDTTERLAAAISSAAASEVDNAQGNRSAQPVIKDEKKDSQEIKPEGEEDEDETFERDAAELLGSFAETKEETNEEQVNDEELMKQFMNVMRAADRDNEVLRVLGAFKLNPFEKLNLRFTATASEVKRQYRC